MKFNQAALLMVVMCVIVLVIVFVKIRMEFIINFILRMVFGAVGIYFLNSLFIAKGLDALVGINFGTVGAIGILGIPGFLLVYAIALFQLL
ncbi:pro-sigmaK processing inhibitor BofA family protein [Lachnotalea glycerini]|uniref:Pro-sigmaK processing inhibitor BofA n=1 Tax=Lachnotalea glycerini TaxID=1763509 RepID=A0A371JET3_9FIRM|nr:pro-sigmaK processing inhibitor BofA family protein [Lachnotalea glycerini]RDY31255.1 Pro-sigmaK processing inhibitor BofA [Lachnotalea glycerini]